MKRFWELVALAPWWLYIALVISLALFAELYGVWGGVFHLSPWEYVMVALVCVQTTIAGVTLYLHREQAHSAIRLHPVVSHFFRFWLWLTTGMVTKEWAAIHRKHHARVETAEDPHSPKIYGINRVLFGGVSLYVAESKKPETMKRFGHGTPEDWLEKNVYTPQQKIGVIILLFIQAFLFGPVIGVSIWLVQMAWIPFWAAGVINGLGHYFGYRNYKSMNNKTKEEDWSTNIVPVAIWIGGEELHNNHHNYPQSAKFSARWYEFDIGWLYLRVLETLGLVKINYAYGRLLANGQKSYHDT